MAGKLPESPIVLLVGPYAPVITLARLNPAALGARCTQPPPIGGRWTPCVASPIRGRWTTYWAPHCISGIAGPSVAPGLTTGRCRCRCVASPRRVSGLHALVLRWMVCSGWGNQRRRGQEARGINRRRLDEKLGGSSSVDLSGGSNDSSPTLALFGISWKNSAVALFCDVFCLSRGRNRGGRCINKYSII